MSVRSRGRYVPRPAPLTARKLRSPQDLNRRRPLARPIPTGPPRGSLFASTTRPVRHSTPLPLSIVARPHEAGLIRSWRADSLAFVWLDPELPHVAKVALAGQTKFFRAADAVCERRRERPHRFIQNRPGTSVVALKSDTAAE